MFELFIAAIGIAAQPVALVGYIVLGVWARSLWQVIGYALAWAIVMQVFVTVTGPGTGTGSGFDAAALGLQFGLRSAGAVVITLSIFLLYRFMRRGSSGGSSGSGNGASPPRQRRTHLRRVK